MDFEPRVQDESLHWQLLCNSFTHLLLRKWCAPVEFEWTRCTLVLNIENLDTNQTKMGAIQQMNICRMQIQSFIEGSARLISFWEMMMYRLSRALLDKAFWAIWTTSSYLFPPFQQSTKEKNMARDTNTCSNNFVIHCPKAYFSQPVGIDVEKKLVEWVCGHYLGVNSDALMERKCLIMTRNWFTKKHLATILSHIFLFFSTCRPCLMLRRS